MEVLFTQETISLIPHWIKDAHIAYVYVWPNPEYQGGKTPSPQNYTPPSHISIAYDKECRSLQLEGGNSYPDLTHQSTSISHLYHII